MAETMAATSGGCSSEELACVVLRCGACHERLSQPVLLPCMHSVCGSCLAGCLSHPNGGGRGGGGGDVTEPLLTCPACGKSSSNVAAARPNHFLAALVHAGQAKAQQQQPDCSACRESSGSAEPLPAVARCAECEHALCTGCLRWHNKFNKRHTVTAIEAAGVGQISEGRAEGGGGGGGGRSSGGDGRRRSADASVAATALPSCWTHPGSSSGSSSSRVVGDHPCDSYCLTCAAPKCGACREACERAAHDVTAVAGAQASERFEALAKQSLSDAVVQLSSLSHAKDEEQQPQHVGSRRELTGSATAAPTADLACARQADLDRLERNKRAALGALEEAFGRARDAVERAYGDVAARLALAAEAPPPQPPWQLSERVQHISAYAQLLSTSATAADLFDQLPQLVGCVRSLLPSAEENRAASVDLSRLAYVVDLLPEQRLEVPENIVHSWTGVSLALAGLPVPEQSAEETTYDEPFHQSIKPIKCSPPDAPAILDATAASVGKSGSNGALESKVAESAQPAATVACEQPEDTEAGTTTICITETAPSGADITPATANVQTEDAYDDETWMLLRNSPEADRSLLTCCLCKRLLTEPMLLGCLHSCCSRCLDAAVHAAGDITAQTDHEVDSASSCHGYVTCTKCNVNTSLIDSKRNGFVTAVLHERRSATGLVTCDPCQVAGKQRQAAEHTCTECGQFLCTDCLRWHRKFYSRHSVKPVVAAAGGGSGSAVQQPLMPLVPVCAQHGSKCDLYCTVCDRLKCISCVKLSCMEAKHDIVVVDGLRSAEHVHRATADVEQTLGVLAEKVAVLSKRVSVTAGTGPSLLLPQPPMPSSTPTGRAEPMQRGDSNATSLRALVLEACERSESAMTAVYGRLAGSVSEHTRLVAELGARVNHAVAYCDLLLDTSTASPTSVLDQHGSVEVCLAKLSSEAEAQIGIMPARIDPDAFTVIERQEDGGHVAVAFKPAQTGSKYSAIIRESDDGMQPVSAIQLADHMAGTASGSDPESDAKEQQQLQQQPTSQLLLHCCVCKQLVAEPVLLECLHNCCRSCVSRMTATAYGSSHYGFDDSAGDDGAVNGTGGDSRCVTCPQCRQTTSCAGLRLNAFAATLSRATQVADAPPKCKPCEDIFNYIEATHLCVDCDLYMCKSCLRRHQKFNGADKVLPVADATAIAASARPTTCFEHDQKHELYCVRCDRMRCTACSNECLEAKHEIATVGSPRVAAHCTQVCAGIRASIGRLRARVDLVTGRSGALAADLDAARRADVRRLHANADSLLATLSAAAAADVGVATTGGRNRLRAATTGAVLAADVDRLAAEAVQRLAERSRRATHYCRTLLASGGTANVLDQRTVAVACLRSLCAEAEALLPAAADVQLSSAPSGGMAGDGGSSSSGGGDCDAVTRFQRWIGVPREDADELLSRAAAAMAASGSLSLSSAESTGTDPASSEQQLSVGSGTSSSGQQSSAASEPSKGPSSLHLQGGSTGGGGDSVELNRIDDSDEPTTDGVILNDIQTEATSDDSLVFVADAGGGGSFKTSEDCRDVAITSDGRVLLAVLRKGMEEYDWASGELCGVWTPPPSDEGADLVSTVHVLEDDTVAVGLACSQSVALLRRCRSDDGGGKRPAGSNGGDDGGGWVVDRQFMLRAGPWRLCGRGDVLATAGARDLVTSEGRRWSPGPYLDLTHRSEGHLLLCLTLVYDVQALAVTGRAVVVLSNDTQLRDGRRFHVVEAYDYGGQRLWFADSGNACDVCASPGGGTLYLAQLHSNRVRAIGADDGHAEGDALTRHDRGVRAPFRIALTSTARAGSIALAVLSPGDGCIHVNVYPACKSSP